jgi:hypothetical protein
LGGQVLSDRTIHALVAANRARLSKLDPLTPREPEVLGEMAQGRSNASIAAIPAAGVLLGTHPQVQLRPASAEQLATALGGSCPPSEQVPGMRAPCAPNA